MTEFNTFTVGEGAGLGYRLLIILSLFTQIYIYIYNSYCTPPATAPVAIPIHVAANLPNAPPITIGVSKAKLAVYRHFP